MEMGMSLFVVWLPKRNRLLNSYSSNLRLNHIGGYTKRGRNTRGRVEPEDLNPI